jgi:RNA polymerase sigma factor (TIGR02999 family)
MGEISELIQRANAGDADAVNRLFSALYRELHALAHARIRRNQPDVVLDTTALLHESYLRLMKADGLEVQNRAHFLAYAARTMRSIVVDFARQRQAQRRGGGAPQLTLDTDVAQMLHAAQHEDQVLRVHEALQELEAVDARMVRVVEMRYFGGLSEEEVGQALGVTARTVRRDWEKARLLLAVALR